MNVTLFLTRRCNLACDYCYESPTGDRMSAETLEKAVRFSTFDGRPVVSVVFFGGEPLLERELVEHGIAFCRQHEKESKTFFHLKISTNGVLLDGETVELFRRAGMLVSLSFDGCRSAHDAHRKLVGGQGTFELVDRAAGLLVEALPHSTVVSVVTPHSVGDLEESVAFLFEKGFRYVIAEPDFTAAWDVDSMRALESGFDGRGRCVTDRGRAGLFITPGYEFRLPYKGLLTNFHLPRSTPLMLVSAFHDRECILESYREAVDIGYRFYSFGDAMMIRRGD